MHYELPPKLAQTPLSSVLRAPLPANLEMQVLSCHTVHKEGEHLAPHRVLASRTGLGTEEGEIITRPGWTEQDTGTLCSHSGCWVPLGACCVCTGPDPLKGKGSFARKCYRG